MRRVFVISTDPAMALDRREQLLARALETLNAIAKASGHIGDVQRVESGDDVLLTWSPGGHVGYAGIDRLPDADPRFALFLTKAPYTTLGEVVTASRFASESGVSDSNLTELAAPFGAVVRASETAPIDVITDVSGLSHLFVRQGNGYSAASNSPQVLSSLDPRGFDDEALQGFSIMGHFDSDRSGFADVRKIPAAHRARLQNGLLTVVRYSTEDMNPAGGSDQQLIKDGSAILRELVGAAVSAHPEPLVLELSGGLDSRAILAAMTPDMRANSRALTLGEPGEIDWELATGIARTFGIPHDFIDMRGLNRLTPEQAWQLVYRSAVNHEVQSRPIATGVLDWVEGQISHGPRFNGNNGEYASGRYYAFQRSGAVTRGRVERLARWWIFANDLADPWIFKPGVLESAREATVSRMETEFRGYNADWFRTTDDHYTYSRMQRWCGSDFSASAHQRPILAPFFCAPYLQWARRLSPDQKRMARVFSGMLQNLNPDLAEVYIRTGSQKPWMTPRDYYERKAITRGRIGMEFFGAVSRKGLQRLRPGTDTPPAGGPSLTALVRQHWIENPSLLEPIGHIEWIDQDAMLAISTGTRIPSTSTVSVLANLIAMRDIEGSYTKS
jgi:asparagine synthase (glutamine-hydrolysing)